MLEGDDRKCGDRGGREPDVTFEEHEAETEVSPEARIRALELLVHWALRRGRESGMVPDGNCDNRLSPNAIKGYDGTDGSN